MRYVPYGPELEGTPNVIVDGRGNDATVLVLCGRSILLLLLLSTAIEHDDHYHC